MLKDREEKSSQSALMSVQQKSELQSLQREFENQVVNTTLEAVKNEWKIAVYDEKTVSKKVKDEIDIDTLELSKKVEKLLDIDEKKSNEEIAVELLKDISINSESKFMKKLAKKMLKRKWWER